MMKIHFAVAAVMAVTLSVAVLISFGSVVESATSAALPSSQAEIQTAVNAAAPGSTVVLPAGTIDVHGLIVPAGVTLAGQDTDGDGRSDTILRLAAGSSGFADLTDPRWATSFVVRLAGTGAQLDALIIDGNKANQGALREQASTGPQRDPSPDPYSSVRAVVEIYCDSCGLSRSVVGNGLFDGVEIRRNNVTIDHTMVHTPGGDAIVLDSHSTAPVSGTRITDSQVDRTGEWFPTVGWTQAGAGPGIGGGLVSDVVIDGLTATRTNGDGVALYATPLSHNITIQNSSFSTNRNHCAHLGGDDATILNNTCTAPGNLGFFLRNNQRDAPVDTSGGRIVNNTISKPRNAGVVVQGASSDTVVNGNAMTGGTYLAIFTDIQPGALAVGRNVFRADAAQTRCQVATAAVSATSIKYSSANPNTFDDAHATRFCTDERQAIPR